MNPITMAGVSSASGAFSEFVTIFETAWDFIWGNWYLAVLIAVPFGGLIVSTVMNFLRK